MVESRVWHKERKKNIVDRMQYVVNKFKFLQNQNIVCKKWKRVVLLYLKKLCLKKIA